MPHQVLSDAQERLQGDPGQDISVAPGWTRCYSIKPTPEKAAFIKSQSELMQALHDEPQLLCDVAHMLQFDFECLPEYDVSQWVYLTSPQLITSSSIGAAVLVQPPPSAPSAPMHCGANAGTGCAMPFVSPSRTTLQR
jgi:hypothetical protein